MSDTTNAALITGLRRKAAFFTRWTGANETLLLLNEAADALEAADARNVELEASMDNMVDLDSEFVTRLQAEVETRRLAVGRIADALSAHVAEFGSDIDARDVEADLRRILNPYRASPEPKEGE